MVRLDPGDLAHHRIRDRVDDSDSVPVAVGLDNHDPARPLTVNVHTSIAAGAARNRRKLVCSPWPSILLQTTRGYLLPLAVSPTTQALSVCHSGSFCEFQCLPPL
jgi:hypothetical protein